jgi:hypothetical protein
MKDFRVEILRQLEGRSHIFRTDKLRQSLDGTTATVLSQYDAAGTGPKNRFFIGKKVAYTVADYLDWICSRVKAG